LDWLRLRSRPFYRLLRSERLKIFSVILWQLKRESKLL
jgi:hypothetical protein